MNLAKRTGPDFQTEVFVDYREVIRWKKHEFVGISDLLE